MKLVRLLFWSMSLRSADIVTGPSIEPDEGGCFQSQYHYVYEGVSPLSGAVPCWLP